MVVLRDYFNVKIGPCVMESGNVIEFIVRLCGLFLYVFSLFCFVLDLHTVGFPFSYIWLTLWGTLCSGLFLRSFHFGVCSEILFVLFMIACALLCRATAILYDWGNMWSANYPSCYFCM